MDAYFLLNAYFFTDFLKKRLNTSCSILHTFLPLKEVFLRLIFFKISSQQCQRFGRKQGIAVFFFLALFDSYLLLFRVYIFDF